LKNGDSTQRLIGKELDGNGNTLPGPILHKNDSQEYCRLNNSISEINIHLSAEDKEKREAEALILNQLNNERLPGCIKSKWALTYKLKMDKAVIDALNFEEKTKNKAKTKGRF